MTTIKSYTDIEQSKKLAEIFPLKSADMKWYFWKEEINAPKIPTFGYSKDAAESYKNTEAIYLPCWSLAALHGVVSTYCSRLEITLRADKKHNVFAVKDDFVFRSFDDHPDGFDNLVDACYDVIIKLHELNFL